MRGIPKIHNENQMMKENSKSRDKVNIRIKKWTGKLQLQKRRLRRRIGNEKEKIRK